MRHRGLAAAAVVVAGCAAVPSSAWAIRDVRVGFTNATDRALDVFVWRKDDWRPLGPMRSDETRKYLTSGTSTLYLWIDGCGQIKVDNPTLGAPYAALRRRDRADNTGGISEGDRETLAIPGLRASATRSDDTEEFKELAVTLTACSPDDSLELPDKPWGRNGELQRQPT